MSHSLKSNSPPQMVSKFRQTLDPPPKDPVRRSSDSHPFGGAMYQVHGRVKRQLNKLEEGPVAQVLGWFGRGALRRVLSYRARARVLEMVSTRSSTGRTKAKRPPTPGDRRRGTHVRARGRHGAGVSKGGYHGTARYTLATPNCCLKATIYYVSCRGAAPASSSSHLHAAGIARSLLLRPRSLPR